MEKFTPVTVYYKAKPSKELVAKSALELEALLRIGYAVKESK